jgi:hypothetical protein
MSMGERAAVPPPESWPSADEVATLLRTRTKDTEGRELGRFTEETRPTGEQVGELIATGAQAAAIELPADVSIGLYGAFSVCVKLYTACKIEESYYPETIASGHSARDQYWEQYVRFVDSLSARIEAEGGGLSGIGSLALVRPYPDRRASRLGSPPQFPELATASVNYDDIDPDTRDWLGP